MSIIKLHECCLKRLEESYDNKKEMWVEEEIYLNTNYIVKFKKCRHISLHKKESVLNKENFSSLIQVKGFDSYIKVKETPEEIIKLIKGE